MHRIGIVGLGKIAQDQHVPVIRKNRDFALVAVSSTRGIRLEGVPHAFTDYREMLRLEDLDAVSICTPPQIRHRIAREALAAGKHVLLEKPPAATLSELEDLKDEADEGERVLFTTWHSQYNRGVEEARQALLGETVKRLLVNWKEDVRHWHPGQQWIWEPGGFGVFDPGINALSIVTRIMPQPLFVSRSVLSYPANREAPIAADLVFTSRGEGEDLRLAPDRSTKLGHRHRDGIGQEAQARRRRQPPRNRRPGRRAREARRIRGDLRALRHAALRGPVGSRPKTVPPRRGRLHGREADRRRAVRGLSAPRVAALKPRRRGQSLQKRCGSSGQARG
jgi:predicted dehydrogenase